jgi:hypothetical protein
MDAEIVEQLESIGYLRSTREEARTGISGHSQVVEIGRGGDRDQYIATLPEVLRLPAGFAEGW